MLLTLTLLLRAIVIGRELHCVNFVGFLKWIFKFSFPYNFFLTTCLNIYHRNIRIFCKSFFQKKSIMLIQSENFDELDIVFVIDS
jgi:hypothetical protein